jgi:hypothetical protein
MRLLFGSVATTIRNIPVPLLVPRPDHEATS